MHLAADSQACFGHRILTAYTSSHDLRTGELLCLLLLLTGSCYADSTSGMPYDTRQRALLESESVAHALYGVLCRVIGAKTKSVDVYVAIMPGYCQAAAILNLLPAGQPCMTDQHFNVQTQILYPVQTGRFIGTSLPTVVLACLCGYLAAFLKGVQASLWPQGWGAGL